MAEQAQASGSQAIPMTQDDIKRMTNMFRFLIDLADKLKMPVDEQLRNNALSNGEGLAESISKALMLAVWIKNKDTDKTLDGLLRRLPDATDPNAVLAKIKAKAVESGKVVLDELCDVLPGTLGAETKAKVAPWIKVAENDLEDSDNVKLCKYIAWILNKVYFSNV